MNISNQKISPQFRGYKNAISYNTGSYAYMAMQLDNEGQPDLDIWKGLQKDLLNKTSSSDSIIFHYINNNDCDYFIIENLLLDIKRTEEASEFEKTMLHAYDLIASITRRIINNDIIPTNNKIAQTLIDLKNNLNQTFNNEPFIHNLCTGGVTQSIRHRKTAEIINSNISKYMKNYFKL